MATSPPAADKADAGAQAKPKSKKKLLIIIIAAVLVLGGGGGAAWFFLLRKPHDPNAAEAPKAKPSHPPTYMALENMVVNLGDPNGDRFAQIGITLELSEAEAEAKIKAQLPSVRSAILLQVSQRTSAELLTIEGKNRLAADIRAIVSNAIGFHLPMSKPPVMKAPEAAPGAPAPMAISQSAPPVMSASGTSSAPAAAMAPEAKTEAKAEAKTEAKTEEKETAKKADSHGSSDETPVANVLFNSFIIQ